MATETDKYGRTALMNAVIAGDVNEVENRLSLGDPVNHQDRNGWSALHFAAQAYSVSRADVLLSHGADHSLKNEYGNTPLGVAVMNSRGRGEVIQLLLQNGADPDAENNHSSSPRKAAELIANYDIKQYFA